MVIKRSLSNELKVATRKSNTKRDTTNNGASKDYSTFLNQMKTFKKNVSIKSKRNAKKRKSTDKTLEIVPTRKITMVKTSQTKTPPTKTPQTKIPKTKTSQTKTPQTKTPKTTKYVKKQGTLNKSFTKNKLRKISYKRPNRNRKNIVVSMPEKTNSKNIKDIQKQIKTIKSKSKEAMIDELKKDGVSVSGKDEQIIRDIYLYSKLCGINIKK